MTIILQHQFWDLVVTDDKFEVGLSFGGTPERLVVPFSAIKSFFDPSVQFGLQFEPSEAEAAVETPPAAEPAAAVQPGPRGDAGRRADQAHRGRRGGPARSFPQEVKPPQPVLAALSGRPGFDEFFADRLSPAIACL